MGYELRATRTKTWYTRRPHRAERRMQIGYVNSNPNITGLRGRLSAEMDLRGRSMDKAYWGWI